MTDITSGLPAGRKAIEAYGDGGFRIGGVRVEGSLLVFAERAVAWPVAGFAEVTLESLAEVTAETPAVEILVVGCGVRQMPAPPGLREGLRDAGVAADFMDTGAACRTFNVLLAEDRRVAAALIAVD
ncbi:MAG: Mth938-like domain-containing protein [Alphaproteobacteria bacterium]